MNEITTVGADLAKEVIVVCAADERGQTLFFKQFSFLGFSSWAANSPPCKSGWRRAAPRTTGRACSRGWVTPGEVDGSQSSSSPSARARGAKNDRNDAQAILSAMREPNMRFVSGKSIEQQSILACHRMRQGWLAERTALINRTRGLLAEFGIWLGRTPGTLRRALSGLAQDETIPQRVRALLGQTHEHLRLLDERIAQCEQPIARHAEENENAKRLSELSGIGSITASAVVATVSNARDFRNGRQMAAWLGLVPRQSSSGGKERLGVITKRGDTYLRGLLVQGARSSLRSALRRSNRETLSSRALDDRAQSTSRLSQNARGHRQQARSNLLGDPCTRRGLRS